MFRKSIRVALGTLFYASLACGQRPPDNFRYYLTQTFGPSALPGTVASAAWSQAWNDPREWGRGGAGFGRRLASSYGRRLIRNSAELGVAYWSGEVLRYDRAGAGSIRARTLHAVKRTFVRAGRGGRTTFAYGRVAGVCASGFAANLWYPESRRGAWRAIERGSLSLGSELGWNVFREFWPDIKRLFRH